MARALAGRALPSGRELARSPVNPYAISRVEVTLCTVPTQKPEADGTLTWSETGVVIVEPRTAGGAQGLGYAWGDAAVAAVAARRLAGVVEGRDVRDSSGWWEAMVRSIRNFGRPGICSMAIAALDIALWDTKARCLDQPLHRLLGPVRDRVPIYGSGGFTSLSVDELVTQMTGWTAMGIPRLKMKVGKDFGAREAEDLERVRAVRDAVGPAVELFVDANGAYSRKQARRVGEAFADLGVSWFEEPVSSDDLIGLAQLRAALPMDVTAGEYGYDLVYFRRMLEAEAVDVLQADAARCAGLGEWLRAAACAAAFGIPFSSHCGPGLHAHAATVPPNLRHIEWFADHVRIEAMLFEGTLVPEAGCLRPAEAPGLGLSLRRDEVRRFAGPG